MGGRRAKAFGKRLDIPSGTCVRFEPGESKTITLIDFGGNKRVFGFNDLTNAQISADSKTNTIAKLKDFTN